MPWTPWRRTSSATWKASTIEVCWLEDLRAAASFGTTISVSTSRASSSMPLIGLAAALGALEGERLGHDANRERADLAGRGAATTGAAPEPMPPPAPAATKTMSEPFSSALDLVLLLEGRAVADLGVGARAEPTRLLVADVDA